MSHDFDKVVQAATKVRKIMGLAAGNENPHEAEAAMRAAKTLADKWGLDMTTLQPITPEMDEEAKREKGRRMSDIYAGKIAQAAVGGVDTTDYTEKSWLRRRFDDNEKEDWDY